MNQITRTSQADSDSVEKTITDIRRVLSVLSENGLNDNYYKIFSNTLFTDICHRNGVSEKRIRRISCIRKSSIKIEVSEDEK